MKSYLISHFISNALFGIQIVVEKAHDVLEVNGFIVVVLAVERSVSQLSLLNWRFIAAKLKLDVIKFLNLLMNKLIQQQVNNIVPVEDYMLHQYFQDFWVFASQRFGDPLFYLDVFALDILKCSVYLGHFVVLLFLSVWCDILFSQHIFWTLLKLDFFCH